MCARWICRLAGQIRGARDWFPERLCRPWSYLIGRPALDDARCGGGGRAALQAVEAVLDCLGRLGHVAAPVERLPVDLDELVVHLAGPVRHPLEQAGVELPGPDEHLPGPGIPLGWAKP
jgi:hypothetical protein